MEKKAGALQGNLAVAAHDFTRSPPDGVFDIVINSRAFQGLSPDAMRAAAVHFHAALRPGGAAIIDTINVQGDPRNLIEDSLMAAGFFIPFQRSERWYRQRLEGTGLVYGMILGRPRVPGWAPYPKKQFAELAARDQQVLDSFRAEYEQRRQDEAEQVTAMVTNPTTVVAHVVYATG